MCLKTTLRRLAYLVSAFGLLGGTALILYGIFGHISIPSYNIYYATPVIGSCQEYLSFNNDYEMWYTGTFTVQSFLDTNRTKVASGFFGFETMGLSGCAILNMASLSGSPGIKSFWYESFPNDLFQVLPNYDFESFWIAGIVVFVTSFLPAFIGYFILNERAHYDTVN